MPPCGFAAGTTCAHDQPRLHRHRLRRDGLQTGTLRIPHSHNRSAYGYIPIPIMVAKRGDGPTVLFSGANHGDEYEGPLALMALARSLPLDSLNGRIIIVPALNMPAYRAGTRVSPIDQVNLNRAFPRRPQRHADHDARALHRDGADAARRLRDGFPRGRQLARLSAVAVRGRQPAADARRPECRSTISPRPSMRRALVTGA